MAQSLMRADTHSSSFVEQTGEHPAKCTKTQILAALSVSLGSLVAGFSSMYMAPAVTSMRSQTITSFEVTNNRASWILDIWLIGNIVGGISGGLLIELLGRKTTIRTIPVLFVIAWLLIARASNIAMVLVGQALSGFCDGVSSLSLPVYLSEIAQPEVRGILVLLSTTFSNFGLLLCLVAGKSMDWSSLAFLGSKLSVPFLVLVFLIPETPRWFVSRGKKEGAKRALQWLRGKQADVEPELKDIINLHADSERHASKNALFELLKRGNLKPLAILLGLMFFQQFSGTIAVFMCSLPILHIVGLNINWDSCVIILCIVSFVATLIAMALIDWLGRKILLYISSVGIILTLFSLGTFMYIKENTEVDLSQIRWLSLASLLIVTHVITFNLGFGPIPWLMMGEILPAKIRGMAASVATGFNFICGFVLTKYYFYIADIIGEHYVFWIFAVISLVGLFFVIFCVPETKGKSLEDIEREMNGRVQRINSVANFNPLPFNM